MALARHRCGSLSQRLLGFCYHPGASGITEERKGQRMKAGKGSKSGGRLKKKAATGGRAKKEDYRQASPEGRADPSAVRLGGTR